MVVPVTPTTCANVQFNCRPQRTELTANTHSRVTGAEVLFTDASDADAPESYIEHSFEQTKKSSKNLHYYHQLTVSVSELHPYRLSKLIK